MEVLKRGLAPKMWPREFICPHCKSLLALDLDDIKRNTDYTGDFSSFYIDCMVCGEQPDVPTAWYGVVRRMKAGYPPGVRACDHDKRCCKEHDTHSTPHVGCILR